MQYTARVAIDNQTCILSNQRPVSNTLHFSSIADGNIFITLVLVCVSFFQQKKQHNQLVATCQLYKTL